MQEAADILSSAATSSSIAQSTSSNSVATATETLPNIITDDVDVVLTDEKKRAVSGTTYTGLYVRRNVRAALSSLFSQKEITDNIDTDSSNSSSNSPDQMTVEQLLEQNNLLKSRIAFLEAEMDKAKNILIQVESLDDNEEWR